MKTEFEKMTAGEYYSPADPEVAMLRNRCRTLTARYNATTHDQDNVRRELLGELLGSVGDGCYMEPPFRCDYGCNIRIGRYFYCNFDCLFLDSAPITIGDRVMLGPGVQLYTPCHPLQKDDRNSGLEYAKPISIGNDVWIGGHAVICPGVSIGSGAVIGAGAVVTRDVPDNVVVAGNPARTIRSIDQQQRELPPRLP